jgi:hypothetical protein
MIILSNSSEIGRSAWIAGLVALYLVLVPVGVLIILVTVINLLQAYRPKLLPGMFLLTTVF